MKTKWHNVKLTENQLKIILKGLVEQKQIIWDDMEYGHATQKALDQCEALERRIHNNLNK